VVSRLLWFWTSLSRLSLKGLEGFVMTPHAGYAGIEHRLLVAAAIAHLVGYLDKMEGDQILILSTL
jgi:hypothetical protein